MSSTNNSSYINPQDNPYEALVLANAVKGCVSACHGAAVAAGWYHDPVTDKPKVMNIGERLMLIVSEISEAMEGHRKSLMDDKLPQYNMFTVELADALIRIFDLAGAEAPNLAEAFVEKLIFNANRPDHKKEARLAPGGKAY